MTLSFHSERTDPRQTIQTNKRQGWTNGLSAAFTAELTICEKRNFILIYPLNSSRVCFLTCKMIILPSLQDGMRFK